MRASLLIGTSLFAAAMVVFPATDQVAHAQNAEANAVATPTPADDQQPLATQQPEIGVGDIIVTASRRSENVQRAALSIQALSGDALTRGGVTRPEDLNAVAPGVNVATGGNTPQTYIRGVGNYAANAYAEGAVAYNLDGVYISRGWAQRGMFFDLDRVEVLKGPQGTLYGRNASGGAINVITAKPRIGEWGGFAEGEIGNYDLFSGAAAINIPLGETLALRASGQIVHRDGYLSDGYDDEKTQSARLEALWKPTTDISLLVTGGYQHVGGMGAGSVVNPKLPGDKWRGNSDSAVTAIYTAEPGLGPLLVTPKGDGFVDIDVYSISAELNVELGGATLTVLPAYRDSTLRDISYVPGFYAADNEHDRQTSVEARLSNDTTRLKWVLGGYFFNEKQTQADDDPLLVVQQGVNTQINPDFDGRIRSYAAFGQATFSVSDAFRLTGGLRYTYERKTQLGSVVVYGFPNAAPPLCSGIGVFDPATPTPPLFCRQSVPLTGRLTYNSVTYKGGFEYDVGPRSMLYANLSSGFKSGGFYSAPQPNQFRPEKLTAFEAGIKNRFLDNRLQVNLEGFYWRYRDNQQAHLGPTSIPGFFTFITENADKAKSYGGDLDVTYVPTPRDRLSLKVQYNKTRYDDFTYLNPSGAFGPPVTGCAVGPLTNGSQTVNCSGKPLARAPVWTGTAGYDHTFAMANGGKIVAGAVTQFSSRYFLSIDYLDTLKQGSYATVDADLGYTAPGGRWSVTGFVRNITDEGVLTQGFHYPFVSGANPIVGANGLSLTSIRPPRTVGARLRVNF